MSWFRRARRQELALTLTLHVPVSTTSPTRRGPTGPARLIMPTDLLVAAWRQLFPAERMVVFGGRHTATGIRVTSVFDVTEAHPSQGHVRSCPSKLGTSLVDLDRTGSHLCAWMHSHPGTGPRATYPSSTDLRQDGDWRRDYSPQLVGLIAVEDGWVRLFGDAIEQDAVTPVWRGQGVEEVAHDGRAFRITLA